MTYENASKWCEENIPVKQFDSYEAWLEQCREELQTPNLFKSTDFNDMLEKIWTRKRPDKPIGRGGAPRPPKTKIEGSRIKARELAEERRVFTTQDFYNENPNRPRSSLRRDLQQLVKEGLLIRQRKGVYRLA